VIRPRVVRPRDSQRKGGIPKTNIGVVVDVPPGSNRISVRLGNLSGRTIRNVAIPDNITFQSGDRVLLLNVGQEPRWIAVTRILDTAETGLRASRLSGENELPPPNTFSVPGGMGLVIGSWDAFTGNTVCWEVEHNSTPLTTGAESQYTRGSYFLYSTQVRETRYVRVRSLRYDVAAYEAYYSRWSNWGSATSTAVSTGIQPVFHVDGPLASAEHVGGTYVFDRGAYIDSVIMHVKNTGTTGVTRAGLNIHRNGDELALWVLESSQPSIYASDPSNFVVSTSAIDVAAVSEGDKLTLDIDSAADGAIDLDIIVGTVT